MSKVSFSGSSVHFEGKVAVVNYSNELKELEENLKAIELKTVDSSDFATLYIINVIDEDYKTIPEKIKLLEKAVEASREYSSY